MKMVLFLMCFCVASLASAETYKCVVNGQTVYQDFPCQGSVAKAQSTKVDSTKQPNDGYEKSKKDIADYSRGLKAELEAARDKQEFSRQQIQKDVNVDQKVSRPQDNVGDIKVAREKFLQIDTTKVKAIADCQKAGCTSSEYRNLLIGRPPGMVEDVLKCNTQEVGSDRIRYCNVTLIDAGRVRNARLQLMTGMVDGLPNGVIPYNRINEVNVY
ncbi:DUF4124 domain-containing protein [Undibacterium sp. TJN19]|uniref:DUF4124 domain-containing protein n=1 Tax=Undibacterium sp. TJN19 TaxID=3413055 RepID=UPI003BF429B8